VTVSVGSKRAACFAVTLLHLETNENERAQRNLLASNEKH
jgi:hypothetical protein